MDKAICPWCGGEIRIGICDDEGNPRTPEYLDNPYSGVGYILIHERKDIPEGQTCPIATFDNDENQLGSVIYDTPEAAYAAATRRPPNRPLTFAQLFSLNDLDAIWMVHFCNPGDFEDTPVINIVREVKSYATEALKYAWLFAAPPTEDDIEAARKEREV